MPTDDGADEQPAEADEVATAQAPDGPPDGPLRSRPSAIHSGRFRRGSSKSPYAHSPRAGDARKLSQRDVPRGREPAPGGRPRSSRAVGGVTRRWVVIGRRPIRSSSGCL